MSRDLRSELAAHLRFFREIGVDGVSSDPAWRTRAAAATPATTEPASGSGVEADADGEPGPASRTIVARQVDSRPSGDTGGPGDTDGTTEAVTGQSADLFIDREEALAAVRADIGDCTRCKLHRLGRTQIVFGVGNSSARLMFVGEAPGQDEDEQGIPFVGKAGQKLTQIIQAIGFQRQDVYIANVIKCRPPGNRTPEPDEVEQCEGFLHSQIDIIRPEVIVALGKVAAQNLLKTEAPISRIRGRIYTVRGVRVVPTYHPAYLLRNPSARREVWEDMKKVMALLAGQDVD